MNKNLKSGLKNFFGSLISNDRAMEGAKNSPWWVTLIIFLAATILPVVPITVSVANTSGGDFLSSYTYSFDTTISKATQELKNDDYQFVINEDKKLIVTGNDVTNEIPLYTYTYSADGKQRKDLEIYYDNRPYSSSGSKDTISYCNTFLNSLISDNLYKVDTIDKKSENDEENTKYYIPSFVFFCPNTIYVYLFQDGTSTVAANNYSGCNYKHFAANTELLTLALKETETPTDLNNLTSAYKEKVTKNWKSIFSKCYIDQKNNSLLYSSLLYLGIYAVLELFMALMLFILTRGKKNPFNYIKLPLCLGIESWASFCPALLAMILGFMFSGNSIGQMAYIMLLGMRIMWLSMKQLRPAY